MTNIHDHNESSTPLDGAPIDPTSKARLPGGEQAEATHYAYDPQTYEILCRPGQSLSEKKIKRLLELNLYTHVVRVGESHSR